MACNCSECDCHFDIIALYCDIATLRIEIEELRCLLRKTQEERNEKID